MDRVYYTALLSLLLCATAIHADLVIRPINTAAVAGDGITLNCKSDENTILVQWTEFITNSVEGAVIAIGESISNPPNKEIYSITSSIVGEYNLGINLMASSGGRYRCGQLVPEEINANVHVIVLETAPSCTTTVPPGTNVVEEGEEYTMTCTVTYAGDDGWAPKMEWKDNNGIIYDVTDESSGKEIKVSVKRTAASEQDGYVYSARTYFSDYEGNLPTDYDTTIPSYEVPHTYDPVVVHFAPRNIQLDPEQETYYPNDQIKATAEGNPTVTLQWKNLADDSVIEGANLDITEDMVGNDHTWQVIATNEVNGQSRNTTKDINFAVLPTPTTTTPEPTTTAASTPETTPDTGGIKPDPSGLSTGAIAGIAVAAALFVIIIIGLIIWLCVRSRKPAPPPAKDTPLQVHNKSQPIHGDQVRSPNMQTENHELGPGASYPDGDPPPYNTYDASNPYNPYDNEQYDDPRKKKKVPTATLR